MDAVGGALLEHRQGVALHLVSLAGLEVGDLDLLILS